MGHFHGIWANCIAALLGTVTPFYSCSSFHCLLDLPVGTSISRCDIFLSDFFSNGRFRKSGLLMSIFGSKVAIIYVIVGLVIAVIGGTIIEKLHLENEVEALFSRCGRY